MSDPRRHDRVHRYPRYRSCLDGGGLRHRVVINVLAMWRKIASHPYGQLAGALHAVGICLAVGIGYVAFGDAGFVHLATGLILLAFAMYHTPRLARMRGSLFSL